MCSIDQISLDNWQFYIPVGEYVFVLSTPVLLCLFSVTEHQLLCASCFQLYDCYNFHASLDWSRWLEKSPVLYWVELLEERVSMLKILICSIQTECYWRQWKWNEHIRHWKLIFFHLVLMMLSCADSTVCMDNVPSDTEFVIVHVDLFFNIGNLTAS